MNMVEKFNALASEVNMSAPRGQHELDSGIPGANPDAVNTLDVTEVSTTEEELRDFNNTMRDLAETSGVEGASGGRILSGAAASSENSVQAERKEKKKQRELTDLVLRMNEIHDHLQGRVDLMNDLAKRLREKADMLIVRSLGRFDMAEDIDKVIDACDEDMKENGKISKGNRDALEKEIRKSREELKLDPMILDALTDRDIIDLGRQTEDDLHKAAHEDHEQAHDCRKTAKTLDERAAELAEKLGKVKALPEDQREAAYREIFENANDQDIRHAVELLDDPAIKQAVDDLHDQAEKIAPAKVAELTQADSDVNLSSLDGMGF